VAHVIENMRPPEVELIVQITHQRRSFMRTQEEDSILEKGKQASPAVSRQLGEQLAGFVAPLLLELDTLIDKMKRSVILVRTLLATLGVIIQFRNRAHGLLLSELGAYLLSADQAPAGTKRLSNLLRCSKWEHTIIERFLWDRAKARVEELERQGEDVLALWDVGRERGGEGGKHSSGRVVCCTLLKSRPPQADQARLLQPTRWQAHLCAGYAVVECTVDRQE
jgi:hypothetical protein